MVLTDCPPLAKPPGLHHLVTNNNISQAAFLPWSRLAKPREGTEPMSTAMVQAKISGEAVFAAAGEYIRDLHIGMSGLFATFDRLRAEDKELPSDVGDEIEAELIALLQRINT